jgi:hypothetical protein
MSTNVNMRGRRGRTFALLLVAVLGATTAAWAFWSQPGKGSASGHVASLNAPTISGATAGGGTVALTWTAVTAPAGGTVSYYVSRDDGAASSACPSAAVPATQTSCTDTGVSVASHSYTVTAVWHSWTAKSATASAQVTSGAATHLVLTPATTSPTAGAADNLSITAKDAANNTVTSYAGSKGLTFTGASTIGSLHPTVSDSAGAAIEFGSASATSTNFTAGVASVSGSGNGVMKLYKAETASIKVSDGTISNGTGVSVTVAAGTAAAFTLSVAARTAASAFAEELTAKDSSGNTATSYTGAKTIAFSGPGASPNGKAPVLPTLSVTFTAGVGTTPGTPITLYDADEAATLTATQGTLSGTSASFVVNPAAISSFALASAPQTAGTPFSQPITAQDAYGNTATSYAGTKTVSFSGPGTSPEANAPKYTTSVGFTAGVGSSEITLYKAETPTLKATASIGSYTGSASFVVSSANAAKLSFSAISTQTAASAFEATITAKDSFGNTATSYSGSKAIAFEGPEASPQGNAPKYPASVTFSSGVGKASPITIYDAGSTALTASDGTIGGKSASFTVNALSTTSRFSLSTPSPTAGQSFSETITAQDTYGNTTTGYTGKQTLTFSGPAKSPNNTSPSYPFQVTFGSGTGSAAITLYDAQTTTLKASQSTISGESDSFAVASGAPSSFAVTSPGAQTAGTAFNLAITAKDAYANGVAGAQPIVFSLPSSAPDGTAPAYPASVTFAAGEAKAPITLSDAQTTQIKLTQGSATTTSSSFTVSPAALSAFALTAASTSVIAGEGDELTIKAVDSFENTITGYTGSKSLTFSGAATSAGKHPTVSSSAGIATNFEAPTSISFTSGVAKVSGVNNGLMRLYAVQTANVAVTDGTFTSPAVAVAVKGASISSMSLKNNGFGGTAKGKIESGDWFAIKFGEPIAVNSMCSLWSGNSSDHSLSGNGEVTVTIVDGTGTADDTVNVSASKCTLHLGTIDLGSSAYVSGGNVTFTGNGSNASTVEYTAGSETVEVQLGGTKGGAGKVAQVGSSVATLTPDPALADEFANAFPTFATTTATQF